MASNFVNCQTFFSKKYLALDWKGPPWSSTLFNNTVTMSAQKLYKDHTTSYCDSYVSGVRVVCNYSLWQIEVGEQLPYFLILDTAGIVAWGGWIQCNFTRRFQGALSPRNWSQGFLGAKGFPGSMSNPLLSSELPYEVSLDSIIRGNYPGSLGVLLIGVWVF